jgi:hypothetical protein
VGALLVTPAFAQQPPSPPAEALELYHVHVVKATADKLSDLIDAYSPGPAARPGDPQVAPIVLRHREGGEWDLIVITPLGKDHALNADPPPPDVQAFNQRIIPITDWHGDTFAVGPPWESVQKALLPARGAQGTVYVVTDVRAVTGHRPQCALRARRGRTVELPHHHALRLVGRPGPATNGTIRPTTG